MILLSVCVSTVCKSQLIHFCSFVIIYADTSPGQTPPRQTPSRQAPTPRTDTPPGQTPPWADIPPGQTPPGQTPPADPPADGYCCGRYASYWNAFLYFDVSMMEIWGGG